MKLEEQLSADAFKLKRSTGGDQIVGVPESSPVS
ncbi:MAG: hypothetical protein ACI9BW_001520 [Gammaproteobacteria bacterium]|jgi:hypothetical protein